MKRFLKQQLSVINLMIVVMSLLPQTLDAQNINISRAFTFARFQINDRDHRLEMDEKIPGVIMFYQERGKEGVCISLGNDIVYNGIITKKDNGNFNGEVIYNYQFYQAFGDAQVPIVLSEIYNPSVSKTVPVRFFLAVINRFSNEMVKSNLFEGISRTR